MRDTREPRPERGEFRIETSCLATSRETTLPHVRSGLGVLCTTGIFADCCMASRKSTSFALTKAARAMSKQEIHFSPKHINWLNLAKIKIGVLVAALPATVSLRTRDSDLGRAPEPQVRTLGLATHDNRSLHQAETPEPINPVSSHCQDSQAGQSRQSQPLTLQQLDHVQVSDAMNLPVWDSTAK